MLVFSMSHIKAATNNMYGKSTERAAAWRLAPLIREATGLMLQRDMKWKVKSFNTHLSASQSIKQATVESVENFYTSFKMLQK